MTPAGDDAVAFDTGMMVPAGAMLELDNIAFRQAQGSFVVPAGQSISGKGTVQVDDRGVLRVNGTIGGVGVLNDGQLVLPAKVSTLAGFSQQSGTLTIPVTKSGVGSVTAPSVQVGNHLVLQQVGGYVPPDGGTFTLFTAPNGLTGTFGDIAEPPGQHYTPDYQATSLKVSVALNQQGLPVAGVVSQVMVLQPPTGSVVVPVTVSLSWPAGQDVQVDYTTQDGSAKAGTDYTATSGTLTIPAGRAPRRSR